VKRTQLKRKTRLRNRSNKLCIKGGDDTAEVKRCIQALLPAIAAGTLVDLARQLMTAARLLMITALMDRVATATAARVSTP